MAKQILRDAYVSVNGVDLSDHVDTVELNEVWPVVDVTGMGALFKQKLLGIGDATAKVTFFNDFATGSVYDTLKGLAGSNTPFPLVIRPVNTGGVNATNPNFTMQAILPQFSPIKGKVGDASMNDVTFENASQTGIVVSET